MLRRMDAFIRAAEDARARLISSEGANVSWAEVIRRAGREDKHGTIMHHLNRNKWKQGRHRVPPWIVDTLSSVLPISPDELLRAAQTAAGYNVVDEQRPDVSVIARYLGDAEISDVEKDKMIADVLRVVTDDLGRRRISG